MSNSGKKITFSFSKVKKPLLVGNVSVEPKEKIEYVDCFDGSRGKFSFRGNIRNDESRKEELVIPMPIPKTSAVVKSRIEEKVNNNINLGSSNNSKEIKSEENKESQHQQKNIEELAALEILNEVQNDDVNNKMTSKFIIETKDLPQEPSENDIDYENVPVTDFGLAMLRGMGWQPDLGIGKEPRLVGSVSPKFRPKGLGLGAQINSETHNEEKEKKNQEKHIFLVKKVKNID